MKPQRKANIRDRRSHQKQSHAERNAIEKCARPDHERARRVSARERLSFRFFINDRFDPFFVGAFPIDGVAQNRRKQKTKGRIKQNAEIVDRSPFPIPHQIKPDEKQIPQNRANGQRAVQKYERAFGVFMGKVKLPLLFVCVLIAFFFRHIFIISSILMPVKR